MIGASPRDGKVPFEIQNALVSSFLKSTLHRRDHIPSRSIPKQAPKIIKRKGIKAWLAKKKGKCFGERKGKRAVTEASN